MKVGIVGFPGSGKTTIFNALTGLRAETGFSGKRGENTGVIKVPDPRVDKLAEMHRSRRNVYAEIQFVDVAAPPDSQTTGGGLPTEVITAMRECDALVQVVRAFDNPMLAEPADAAREIAAFREELILSDLAPLENRRERMKKQHGPEIEKEKALVDKSIAVLEGEQPLRRADLSPEERQALQGFTLLTLKPLLLLLNQDEGDFPQGVPDALEQVAREEDVELMAISGKVEQDIAELEPEEQGEFLAELGVGESARDRFVQRAYAHLDLISFLTTGEDESRAWPIKRGTTAQRAAGRIHSDIERGFIRAEVIHFDELVALGGEKAAKDAGKMRLEGKEYVVQDGDVITFRFNV